MTDKEKAIIMAYTGVCMLTGDRLNTFYDYVNEIMGRPIFTHELSSKAVWAELRSKSEPDFIKLCKETTK